MKVGLCIDEFDSWGIIGKLLMSFKIDIVLCLGFIWDLIGIGDMKVYGIYGCYYLFVVNNMIFCVVLGVSDIIIVYIYIGVDLIIGVLIGFVFLVDVIGSGGLINL